MELNEEQEDFCLTALRNAIGDDKILLPVNLETGKVYKSKYYVLEHRDVKDLRFKIEFVNQKLLIDYLFKTDDYSSHNRIDYLGNVTSLENYEGQFGLPVFKDKQETEKERDRVRLHNQSVYEILKTKGLED